LPRKTIDIKLNKELCKGCGYCVEFCPRRVFMSSNASSQRGVTPPDIDDKARCTDCGLCVMLCPELAISIERDVRADD
jgi:2-oxoglutarate ferredoxin oxidoreductase subunit delta